MNIYISGSSSGLGKFLFKNISNSKKFYRNKRNNIQKNSVLIYCSFFKKSKQKESIKEINHNKKVTLNLFEKIKEAKFDSIIFISSVDVYKKKDQDSYIILKNRVENKVKKTQNYFILRCGLLVGKFMSKNSFYHLIKSKSKKKLSLSKESSCYLTSYTDILIAINKIISKKIRNGIYNVTTEKKFYYKNYKNENISFGNFKLNYGKISNKKFEKNFRLKVKKINKIIKEIENI